MFQIVPVHTCGQYHPYWHMGVRNPRNDRLSRMMMDFKDEQNGNHQRAVNHFSELLINKLSHIVMRNTGRHFVSLPFIIAIVPSHTAGRISPALQDVAQRIVQVYPHGTVYNCLTRTQTVPSAHREGGDRSVAGHMSSISTMGCNLQGRNVLLLDDVKTTGGSLTACYYLLETSGAGVVIPVALLETANYEG